MLLLIKMICYLFKKLINFIGKKFHKLSLLKFLSVLKLSIEPKYVVFF